jgi:hypothetical protein
VVYQEFLQEKSRQRSDEARTGWFDDEFKPPHKFSNSSKVSEPRFEVWKRYHCLANFMPLPSELNRWRGYMFKGYPSNGWRDRIDKFLSWVSFGYEEQADEYLLNSQRVFCLYKKHYFDYFGSFEAFLELNYLPNIRDIEEYREHKGIVTLLDTMDAFLDYRADKMADGLLALSKGQLH